jgi:hypothetical protein
MEALHAERVHPLVKMSCTHIPTRFCPRVRAKSTLRTD